MSKRRLCILIIDDEEDILSSFAMALDCSGYDVMTAGDGEQALALLQHAPTKPDVILLDYMMPRANGRYFRERQRAQPELAHIPVVLVTAAANIEPLVDELRVEQSLQKPVALADLLRTIELAVARSAANFVDAEPDEITPNAA